MIARIRKGQQIKAEYLNQIGSKVNDLVKAIQPPRQKDKPVDPLVSNASLDSGDTIPEPDYSFVEQTRAVSTIQVFDQNSDNYAEIDRIESMTFQNGRGETLRLVFNN